jgi:flagellar basal-body rod protein FlgG
MIVLETVEGRVMGYGVVDVAKAGSERITQLDTIANNLANASTPGFKVENFYPGAPDKAAASDGPIPLESRAIMDYSQGLLRATGNPLDLAIQGEGFFTIQTKNGVEYTRKGSFVLNREGRLSTFSGDLVMGNNGPVTVTGKDFYVDGVGNVMVDGAQAGRLQITRFENPAALLRTKDGMFKDGGKAGASRMEKLQVMSRSIEMSNVNVFKEMVGMIDVQRSFESYQKVIQTIADLDKMSVNRIGKLA